MFVISRKVDKRRRREDSPSTDEDRPVKKIKTEKEHVKILKTEKDKVKIPNQANESKKMSSKDEKWPSAQPREEATTGKSMNYKTVPCKSFSAQGSCKYGDSCQFMHGPEDFKGGVFRKDPNLPYKQVPCRNFSTTGVCAHGERCQFIHGNELGLEHDMGHAALAPRAGVQGRLYSAEGGRRGIFPVSRPGSASFGGGPAGSGSFGGGLINRPNGLINRPNGLINRPNGMLNRPTRSAFLNPAPTMPQTRQMLENPFAGPVEFKFKGRSFGGRDLSQINTNYKTVECNKFAKEGKCPYGSNCQFRHGNEDVDAVRYKGIPNQKRGKCTPFFTSGFCPDGDRCPYAHIAEDLGAIATLSGALRQAAENQRYKAVPCVSFAHTGFCEYGDMCWFIHGNEGHDPGLQKLPLLSQPHLPQSRVSAGGMSFSGPSSRNPNYKTAFCKAFSETGSCGYGDSCQFKHGANDRGNLPADLYNRPPSLMPAAMTNAVPFFKKQQQYQVPRMTSNAMQVPRLNSSAIQDPWDLHRTKGVNEGAIAQNRGLGKENPNYKKAMCKNWSKDGTCSYEERCQFKHGVADVGS